MIAVIADDFTGAAEIGGVGLKYGLRVVLETKVELDEHADLLIIAADTRNLSVEDAVKKINKLTKQLMELKPRFIYKKIDSALRGNVAEELCAQMQVEGKGRSIVVAGNPEIKRLIINGIYYIDDVPLSETFFAQDKEYRIQSSQVTELIQSDICEVKSVSRDAIIPQDGLLVVDVHERGDMQKWLSSVDAETVLAGGASFFDVVLEQEFGKKDKPGIINYQLGNKALIVFGSAYPKDAQFLQSLVHSGVKVSNMPDELYWASKCDSETIEKWTDDIVTLLSSDNKVILTINQSGNFQSDMVCNIKDKMAKVVRLIVKNVELDDMLIEGGATTSSILKSMKVTRLYPFKQIESGVIQMSAHGYPNLYITTKPGSYLWPTNLLLGELTSKS